MVRNHAGLLDGCDHLLHPGTTMTTTTPTPTRSSAVPALALAVVATLPYLALKGLWLSGSSVGLTPEAAAEMHTGRFLIGNSVTVVLEILALVLAWSLTRPWAARVPTRLFALLAAGASGLLAPILLGLPLGQVAQTVVHGSPSFEGEGMAPWVFACVYGGFVLLGVALAWSIVDHARERWGAFFSTPPSAGDKGTLAAGAIVPLGDAAVAARGRRGGTRSLRPGDALVGHHGTGDPGAAGDGVTGPADGPRRHRPAVARCPGHPRAHPSPRHHP